MLVEDTVKKWKLTKVYGFSSNKGQNCECGRHVFADVFHRETIDTNLQFAIFHGAGSTNVLEVS